uniref:Uncharacterized protein n=1 Tax=Arundo donax TaxID=35708 RepID=A0A0A8XQI2_ARUDO
MAARRCRGEKRMPPWTSMILLLLWLMAWSFQRTRLI